MSTGPAAPETPDRTAPRFRRLRQASVLGVLVPVADRPLVRLLGLAHLDRDRAGSGLLLERCSAVHTFGMRFELDVLFLDADGAVLRIERAIGPRRFLAERRAFAVLEVPAAGPQAGPSGPWRGPAATSLLA